MEIIFKRNLLLLLILSGIFNSCRSAQSIRDEEEKRSNIQRANERNERLFIEYIGQVWKLDELNHVDYDMVDGSDVIEGQEYTISFNSDGTFSGKCYCNTFSGKYELQRFENTMNHNIVFSDVIVTKLECEKPSHEKEFLKVLYNAETYGVYPEALIITYEREKNSKSNYKELKFVKDTL